MEQEIQHKRSFTLIELLVVIAIIGLLSSVILVSLSGPRQRARITRSLEFSQSVQHAIGNEAVGVWNFDDCSAKDLSGYKNDGTINGAICVDDTPYKIVGSGQGKNTLSFDGVDDYVDLGNPVVLQNMNEGTIVAWFKRQGTTGIYQMIFSDPGSRLEICFSGNWLQFYINNAAVSISLPTLDVWYYVVGNWSISGNFQKLYLSAVEVGSRVPTGNTGSAIRTIGSRSGSYPFNGIIDDVRIYSTALSLSEIQQFYLAGLEKHQQLTIK